jgi:hypothetical protein
MKGVSARAPAWLLFVVMAASGLLLGFGARAVNLSGAALVAMIAFLIVAAGFGAVVYWRRLDEAAREAHKFAWYWGGSFGMAIAIVLAVTLTRGGLDTQLARMSEAAGPGNFVSLGMMAAMGVQAVCYLVVWAGWWISKR